MLLLAIFTGTIFAVDIEHTVFSILAPHTKAALAFHIWIDSFTTLLINPLLPVVLIVVFRLCMKSNLFVSKYQRGAAFLIMIDGAMKSFVYLLFAVQHLEYLIDAHQRAVSDWIYSALLDYKVVKLYLSNGGVITSIPLLFLICPPSLRLSSWKPAREAVFRILFANWILLQLMSFIVSLIPPDPNASFLRSASNLWWATSEWVYPALFLLFTIMFLHFRSRAHQLIADPNHCTNCAYPLDQSITTCPECGTTRPAQPAPTTPLPEG